MVPVEGVQLDLLNSLKTDLQEKDVVKTELQLLRVDTFYLLT